MRTSGVTDKLSHVSCLVLEIKQIRGKTSATEDGFQSGSLSFFSSNVFGDKWLVDTLIAGDNFWWGMLVDNG